MLRKFILLLLCVMLGACTHQGNGDQVVNSTLGTNVGENKVDDPTIMVQLFYEKSYPSVLKNRADILFPIQYDAARFEENTLEFWLTKDSEINSPQIHMIYDRIDGTHEFNLDHYSYNYLTNGNVRTVDVDFYVEFHEYLEFFAYQSFVITITTQDNIVLTVSYDMEKQEFYDASEGALEYDVMNFNEGMKRSLLMYSEEVINTLRNAFAVIETFNLDYQKYLETDGYIMRIADDSTIRHNLNTNSYQRYFRTIPLVKEVPVDFTVNFIDQENDALRNAQHILYNLDKPFNTPNEIFSNNSFFAPVLLAENRYGCMNGLCSRSSDKPFKIYIGGGDGDFTSLYSIQTYRAAMKDIFGLDSTYTLETGINEYGFYEDAELGVITAQTYDGDGPTIPYGLYVTDSKEENGILTLTYKKYDMCAFVSPDDAFHYTTEKYIEEFTEVVMTYPTWTATLKYNPEKDVYQILSITKE